MITDTVNFQTPVWCCQYMVSLIPDDVLTVLEPTPGAGNLVTAVRESGRYVVDAPECFEDVAPMSVYDCIIMNPPFTPIKTGYNILFQCLDMSDCVIALMPWLTVINSERRTARLKAYGLKSIIHLPRTVFPGSRVQCCVLNLQRGYLGDTQFIVLEKSKWV